MGQKVLEFGRRPFSSRVVLFMPTVEPVLSGLKPLPPSYDRLMLASFNFGWRGGLENSSIRENNASTNFATSLVPFSLFRKM